MEYRLRRQNVLFRGILDDVSHDALPAYILSICKALFPGLPDSAWVFDRIIGFHTQLASQDTLLAAARKSPTLPDPHQCIALFVDLSAATMAKRKEFITITTTLRTDNVPYRWGYPTKLLLWRQGKTHVVNDPADGMKLLTEWAMWNIAKAQQEEPTTSAPRLIQAEWQMVGTPAKKTSVGAILSSTKPRWSH
ncbi:Hypothetical predicted protein [Pelobates cultripes]|uniref:Uncharacterized protein n=1 Tax=Pelobates cultripes TaxID=61616 RepID=A0AAD1W1D3_PELCU|nr:Hypothetical predicted protein [Pelobates cultripes]